MMTQRSARWPMSKSRRKHTANQHRIPRNASPVPRHILLQAQDNTMKIINGTSAVNTAPTTPASPLQKWRGTFTYASVDFHSNCDTKLQQGFPRVRHIYIYRSLPTYFLAVSPRVKILRHAYVRPNIIFHYSRTVTQTQSYCFGSKRKAKRRACVLPSRCSIRILLWQRLTATMFTSLTC